MNKKGAIIIVEDDKDDQELFDEVFKELNYKMKVSHDGQEALSYLIDIKAEPFIVFSDIMPN
jgi:CheY-like chemotaxis protein